MINEVYLNSDIERQMRESYNDNGFIVISDFLKKGHYNEVKKLVKIFKFRKECAPNLFSYSETREKFDFFAGKKFLEFIGKIVGMRLTKVSCDIRKFTHRDYTLIHDADSINSDRIEFFYFILNKWENDWGGMKYYFSHGEANFFIPLGNALCIVLRKKGTQSFVKYVNNLVGKKEFVIVSGSISLRD